MVLVLILDSRKYGHHQIYLYSVNMVKKFLTDLDTRQVMTVLATFVDWKDVFPNQCPAVGIKAFLDCGVRPSLIPVLISHFQNITIPPQNLKSQKYLNDIQQWTKKQKKYYK